MTTIGIDLTPIQGPHRMRGVGATVINVLRSIPDEFKQKHHYVFYCHEDSHAEALELIHASTFPNTTVRSVEPRDLNRYHSIKTPRGLLQLPARILERVQDRIEGDHRIKDIVDLDIFLQFEQDIVPPRGVKTVMIGYDLIPYVLESDYLWSYKTARQNHRYSILASVKAYIKRRFYRNNLRACVKRARKVIAISHQTKSDFVRYLKVSDSKITVSYLGINKSSLKSLPKPDSVIRYIHSSWGDIPVETSLPAKPFLLFVGGADPRRKLTDLVAVYNLLKAQGRDIALVLAGDTMLGFSSVPNMPLQQALLNSSYPEDIYMLGFVDEDTREWLYKNAIAFVYPSRYEGFGLPILEAMQYGTPVITYKNSSIQEIAKDSALYAHDDKTLFEQVKSLSENIDLTKKYRTEGAKLAKDYAWEKTSSDIMNICEEVTK
tara:strand:- start:2438 stop:3739 length:1302 start_codon:yes stop_codon:yes gene_type:complete